MQPPPNYNRFEKKIYTITHRPAFMFALFSSTSMTILGGTIVATSLPQIERHFATIDHIDILSKLILTLPALCVMLVSPISGILLDKFGRLRFLIPAMFLWSISGMLAIAWDNIYWILFTRILFGIATTFVMTSASALVADYYTGEDRQVALGLQGFATACGSAIFMCLGGFLATYDWHYPFYVYGIGIILAILVIFMLFEPRIAKQTQQTQHSQNTHFNILPFLPIYFFAFTTMTAYFISPTQIPHFLTQNLGKSEMLAGICVSGSALAYGLSSVLYARIRRILSIKMTYIIGFFLMGCGFLCIYIFHSFYSVFFGLFILGCGGGCVIVNNSSSLLMYTPAQHRGKMMGILSSVTFFGQFVSPLISQPLVRNYGVINLFLIGSLTLFTLSIIAMLKASPTHK